MIVEMVLLVLIAAVVFAYVLAPLVRTDRSGTTESEQTSEVPPVVDNLRETVVPDSQPLRDAP
jgi:hypothetical protein